MEGGCASIHSIAENVNQAARLRSTSRKMMCDLFGHLLDYICIVCFMGRLSLWGRSRTTPTSETHETQSNQSVFVVFISAAFIQRNEQWTCSFFHHYLISDKDRGPRTGTNGTEIIVHHSTHNMLAIYVHLRHAHCHQSSEAHPL